MSSSSSPGVSLMMEGISYVAGTELPLVLVDVMRGGPGLGNIAPSQGDYSQIVHGGGHGDFHPIVLAPASVQEAIDFTVLAFDLAEKYRAITVVLLDGSIGQMMEPAELPPMQPLKSERPDWATDGAINRERRILSSIYIDPYEEEIANIRIMKRWEQVKANEVRYKEYFLDDAEIVIVGYGTAGRVALSAVRQAREEGIKVGLFRPITVSPFPTKELRKIAENAEVLLVVEMSAGQMLIDVRQSVGDTAPIEFYGRLGGVVPFPDEILAEIYRVASGDISTNGDARERWLDRLEASVMEVD
jgi:2-oxoglutarate ferredoxin oxidoreductase subunit alpha